MYLGFGLAALVVAVICCVGCCVDSQDNDIMLRYTAVLAPVFIVTVILCSFWISCVHSDQRKVIAFFTTLLVFSIVFVVWYIGVGIAVGPDLMDLGTRFAYAVCVFSVIASITLLTVQPPPPIGGSREHKPFSRVFQEY